MKTKNNHKLKTLLTATILGWTATLQLTAATLTVTNATDGAAGSLRARVAAAAGGDVITFDSSLSGQTLALTNEISPTASPLTITATNLAARLTLQGNGVKRVIYNGYGLSLTISGVTITGGGGTGADTGFNNHGGGVLNRGTLTMDRCTLTANSASYGGGIENSAVATLVMTNCTISGNNSTYSGGISIIQDTTLLNCTISSNSSSYYAGGDVSGTAVLKNCTIAHNTSSSQTGWLLSGGNMTMINCTFASNSAASLGGIVLFSATLLMTNTILVGNSPADLANVSGGTIAGTSNLIGGNPLLGPLQNNGGPTLTMAISTNSPAFNAGTAIVGLNTDQRGRTRQAFGAPDIGAYEFTAFDTGQTIVTTPDGAYWYVGLPVTGSDLSIYREVSGQLPVNVGGAALRIGQANDSTVLVENSTGGVYSRTGSTSGIGSGWQQLTSVTAGDAATWFLGPDAGYGSLNIYRWATNGLPTFSNGAGTNLTVLFDGSIMTRAYNQTTFRRLGSSAGLGSAWVQVYLATNSPTLKNTVKLGNGSVQFSFTNQSGLTFSVYASTNAALPLAQWTPLGNPVESPAGSFQFADSQATNAASRFYRVTSP